MASIETLARELGLPADALVPFGRGAVKLVAPPSAPRGRIVLVSAITPTSHGEGKTTLAIGLADALRANGERATVALRQPSLGPLFGIKSSKRSRPPRRRRSCSLRRTRAASR
jgi:formate--tetrahydrofolate ligase